MRSHIKKQKSDNEPILQMVHTSNDKGGNPESLGLKDNRSGAKSEVAYQLMMNHSPKERQVGPSSVIQRVSYESLGVMNKYELRNYEGRNGWDEESIRALVEWSISLKQIRSVLGNMSAEEWKDLKEVHANGSELNTKVKKPTEELNPDTKRKGQNRSNDELRRIMKFWGKMANPTSPSITLSTLISYQKTYEKLLLRFEQKDHTNIMDTHRTMGIELEFAHYAGENLGAHGILAKSSSSISSSVPGEWVLETDDSQKLEIGTPPFLIQDLGQGKLNVPVIRAIREIVKKSLQQARDQFSDDDKVEDFVKAMPAKGLGNNWKKTNKLNSALKFRGAKERGWFSDHQKDFLGLDYKQGAENPSRKRMYEQINLTLTPSEIAENMEKQKEHESVGVGERSYDWVYRLNDDIKTYLSRFLSGSPFSNTRTIMAKGLAGVAALPSIVAATGTGIFSSIKEIFGIWVKDNTPNQVVNSIPNQPKYIDVMLAFTSNVVPRKKRKKKRKPAQAAIHTEAIGTMVANATEDNEPEYLEINKSKMKKEVGAMLNNIHGVLVNKTPITNQPRSTYDQSESFEDEHAGLGSRKDTYLNIRSGDNRKLHLAEVRSDWTIDRFMNDNE